MYNSTAASGEYLTKKKTIVENLNIDTVKDTPFPNNGLKNILLMDDQFFPILTLRRVFHTLSVLHNQPERKQEIVTKAMVSGRDVEALTFAIDNFRQENFNIFEYTDDRCGFEVIASLRNPDSGPIHLAILDIILGAGLLDTKTNELISVDGIDVAVKLREKYSNINIMFNSGCVLGLSKESYKLQQVEEKIAPYSYSDKPFDNDLWLIDAAVAVSNIL